MFIYVSFCCLRVFVFGRFVSIREMIGPDHTSSNIMLIERLLKNRSLLKIGNIFYWYTLILSWSHFRKKFSKLSILNMEARQKFVVCNLEVSLDKWRSTGKISIDFNSPTFHWRMSITNVVNFWECSNEKSDVWVTPGYPDKIVPNLATPACENQGGIESSGIFWD